MRYRYSYTQGREMKREVEEYLIEQEALKREVHRFHTARYGQEKCSSARAIMDFLLDKPFLGREEERMLWMAREVLHQTSLLDAFRMRVLEVYKPLFTNVVLQKTGFSMGAKVDSPYHIAAKKIDKSLGSLQVSIYPSRTDQGEQVVLFQGEKMYILLVMVAVDEQSGKSHFFHVAESITPPRVYYEVIIET